MRSPIVMRSAVISSEMSAWARFAIINTGSLALLGFVLGDYANAVWSLGPHGSSWYAALTLVALTLFNLNGQQGMAPRVSRSHVSDLFHARPDLFAYTGTATVYAAAGGARATTTVDLSNTYLDWARRNLDLNGHTVGGANEADLEGLHDIITMGYPTIDGGNAASTGDIVIDGGTA